MTSVLDKIKLFIKELRYTQWVKNLVVFLPLFFGGRFFELNLILHSILAFLIFSLSASIVYVINDIRDIEEDRKHPDKKHRPLASGAISKNNVKMALIFMSILLVIALIITPSLNFKTVIITYLVLNVLYSFKLKRFPILEMLIVSFCYSLRLLGGGLITGIEISPWLNLLIFAGAMLIIGGKRYTEKRNSNVRHVLKHYSEKFLKIWVLLTAVFSIIFMFLYAFAQGTIYLPQSIIFALAIVRFIFLLEKTNKGESTEILNDKIIIVLLILFTLYSTFIIY